MNYDDILLFVKLVNIGTFSGLAKSINVTQSTISKKIQKLEQQLNLQLIHRNSRTLELTADGELLYENFRYYEGSLKDSLSTVINRQNKVAGILKVSLPKIINDKILLPHFYKFMQKYPEAKIIISYNANRVDLLKEGFNLAISMQQPISENNKIRLLKKSKIKLFTTTSYQELYGLPQTPSDLPKHNLVAAALNGEPLNDLFVTNINSESDELVRLNPSLYVSNAIYNVDLTTSGHFIASSAEILVYNELLEESLIPVLPDYCFGSVNFYLLRSNEIHTKLEQVFVDFIVECFDQIPSNFN